MKLLLTALALVLAAAPDARAQVPAAAPPSGAWERTGLFGAGSPANSPRALLTGYTGGALIAWRDGRSARLATWQPGAEPVVRESAPGDLVGGPAPVSVSRLLTVRVTAAPRGPRVSLLAGSTTASGRFGPARTIARFVPAGAYAAASGPGGRAAVAWIESRGRDVDQVAVLRLVTRSPRGRLSRPRTLARLGAVPHPGVTSVAVAYAGRRLVVAAPQNGRQRRVLVVTGTPGRFARQGLGPHRGVTQVAVATGGGRAVAAWATQDPGEEAGEPYVVRAAVRAPGAARFGAPQAVDPGAARERSPGRLALAVADGGEALLAWTQPTGPGYSVRSAGASPGAGFGPFTEHDSGGTSSDVAFGPGGSALVAWSRILEEDPHGGGQAFVALRPQGAVTFGAPEAASAAERARDPLAAFTADGRPLLVWAARGGMRAAARTAP